MYYSAMTVNGLGPPSSTPLNAFDTRPSIADKMSAALSSCGVTVLASPNYPQQPSQQRRSSPFTTRPSPAGIQLLTRSSAEEDLDDCLMASRFARLGGVGQSAVVPGSPNGSAGIVYYRSHQSPVTSQQLQIQQQHQYELSDDLRTKQVEMLARKYGGQAKAARAARVIQNAYRRYRLNRSFARMRLEAAVASSNERRLSHRYVDFFTPFLHVDN